MTIALPPLPYSLEALEPHLSRRTLEFHHGKHHKAYVDNTAAAIKGTPLEDADLVAIIRAAKAGQDAKLFNNSAQAWNHSFFWLSMTPRGGGRPAGKLGARIDADFGGFDSFRKAFVAQATGQFGSGWAWLLLKEGRLSVSASHDAATPVADSAVTPLMTVDVWEHAYYLDYQNCRAAFVDAFLDHLVDWDEVERRLLSAP